jgi:hypothetical protein
MKWLPAVTEVAELSAGVQEGLLCQTLRRTIRQKLLDADDADADADADESKDQSFSVAHR